MISMTSMIAIATAASSIAFSTAGAAETTAMGEQKLRWETGSVTVHTEHMIAEGQVAPYDADARAIELIVSYGPDGPYLTGSVTYLECAEDAEQCVPVGEEAHLYGDGSTVDVTWEKQAKGVTAVGTASIRAGWDEIDTLEVDVWTEPQGKASRVREEGRTIISRDQFVHGTVGGYPVSDITTTHVHTINKR